MCKQKMRHQKQYISDSIGFITSKTTIYTLYCFLNVNMSLIESSNKLKSL
jgi:hypothetical protein